jgi:hypothetical protein
MKRKANYPKKCWGPIFIAANKTKDKMLQEKRIVHKAIKI